MKKTCAQYRKEASNTSKNLLRRTRLLSLALAVHPFKNSNSPLYQSDIQDMKEIIAASRQFLTA